MNQKFHFYFGGAGIIIFLLTGQYMDIYHNHLQGMADGPRMLFRSNHIYLLILSISNLLFSQIQADHNNSIIQKLDFVLRLCLIISPILVLIGFFLEPYLDNFDRPYTRPAIYLVLGIGILIILRQFLSDKSSNE